MNHVICNDLLVPTPPALRVRNYREDGEPHFPSTPRPHPPQHCVLHETGGRTAASCKRTLLAKGLGVQLILDRDGTISNHGDLVRDQQPHANQLNASAVGIEIVNPYTPATATGLTVTTIPATWWTWVPGDDRRYVLPAPEQLAALAILVPWLCGQLGIPYCFPTLGLSAACPRIPGGRAAIPPPGVVAHRDFSTHADGRYPLEYLARQVPPAPEVRHAADLPR